LTNPHCAASALPLMVRARLQEGMLPIHFAAWFNRLDVAALLLDKGSMINPPTNVREFPHFIAVRLRAVQPSCQLHCISVVYLLLDKGSMINPPTKVGGFPRCYAVHFKAVQLPCQHLK
jgi:ankyrin repeat protein